MSGLEFNRLLIILGEGKYLIKVGLKLLWAIRVLINLVHICIYIYKFGQQSFVNPLAVKNSEGSDSRDFSPSFSNVSNQKASSLPCNPSLQALISV